MITPYTALIVTVFLVSACSWVYHLRKEYKKRNKE